MVPDGDPGGVDTARDLGLKPLALGLDLGAQKPEDLLETAVFQVQNTLSYSNPFNPFNYGTGFEFSDLFTTVNLEILKTGGKPKFAGSSSLQAMAGNFAPLTIDKIDLLKKTTGLSGLAENTTDANLGEVIVRSGFNFVRGTDYAFKDVKDIKKNPTALLTSGADTISVGDNIFSATPGIHILAGGSGADTYRFNTQFWGGALILDDLFQPSLSLGDTGDAIIDTLIPAAGQAGLFRPVPGSLLHGLRGLT